MAQQFHTFDLDQLRLIILGIPIDGGYGEGECVQIEYDDADFTVKKGADGNVVRSKTYNSLAKITLTLMQTAEWNPLLSAIRLMDIKGKNGAGIGPCTIKDSGGASLYFAPKCWIEGPPKATFGREATHRDWVIMCQGMESFEGGN